MNTAEQQGMPFAMTVGQGKSDAQGKYYRVDSSVEAVAEAIRTQPPGLEQWFSLHLWQKNYRTGDGWLASTGVVIDIDYDIKKTAPPSNLVNQLLSLATDNDLPGSIFYLTPGGCRVAWVYARPCSDRDLQIKAERGAAALLKRVIPKGYHIDSSTVGDLARFFYTPNCTAKNRKRDAEVLVMGQNLTDPVDLGVYEPHYVAQTAPEEDEGDATPISSTYKQAIDKWNTDHAQAWPKSSGTCPMCGHNECFGRLPKAPERWFCWSANHDGPGIPTDDGRGHHGDALDVEAHKRGISPAQVLRADGYLEKPKTEEERNSAAVVVATFRTVAEVLRSDDFKKPRTTTPTSIADFDHLIGGGFKSRQLVVFAAPTGKGKTGLVGTIAYILAGMNVPVLWITTELDDNEQAARLAAIACRSTNTNATPDDFLSHRLPAEHGAVLFDDSPLCLVNLDDPDSDALTLARVNALGVRDRFGRMPIIVVDYLQVLAPEDPDRRRMSVSRVANSLRRMARDLDTTIVAVSSVSRAYYGKKDKKTTVDEEAKEDPRDWIAAAKESGDIEYACSVFGYLDTANEMNALGESEARLIVAKSRAGVPGFVGLRFHGPSGLFIPASDAVARMRPEARSKGPADTDRVIKYIRKHPGQTMKAIKCSVPGLGKDKIEVAMDQLETDGVIFCRREEYKDASKRVRQRDEWFMAAKDDENE